MNLIKIIFVGFVIVQWIHLGTASAEMRRTAGGLRLLSDSSPDYFCSQTDCTPTMQRIEKKFQTGTVDFIQQNISAYTGVCYHIDANYDPEYAHYGVMTFEKTADQNFLINGYFGFFFENDPYQNWPADQVLADVNKTHRADPGTVLNLSVQLNYSTPTSQIDYYMRSSADFSRLYLIGHSAGWSRQSWNNYLFCELVAH